MSADFGRSGRRANVTLRPVTAQTVRAVCDLAVKPHQTAFVAPNAVSLAQALFEPAAWYRAIYADDVLVGFVMLYDGAEKAEYFIWRFMVSGDHQGMGYGRRALALVVDYVRTRPGARELRTSYVPGEGNPGPFYVKFGFEETGEEEDGERVLRLRLG